MKRINYHNEKGNVMQKVRVAQKAEAVKELREMLGKAGASYTESPKGLAIPFFEDENGTVHYAVIDVVITDKLEGTVKAKADKPVEVIETGSMFAKE